MLIFSLLCLLHLWVISLLSFISTIKNKGSWHFSIFIFLFSFLHVQHASLQSGLLLIYPYIDPICGVAICLSFPYYFLYTASLCKNFKPLSTSTYIHLIAAMPAIINLVYLLIFKNSADLKEYYYEEGFTYTLQNTLLLLGMCFLMAYYIWLSNRQLIRHDQAIKNNYSTIEHNRLNWLYNFNLILILLAVVIGPILILMERQEWNIVVIGVYTSVMYLYILYRSFNNGPVGDAAEATTDIESNALLKLSDERINEINGKLTALLNEAKPWLVPGLTLIKLSSNLNIPAYQLSFLINFVYKKNFFDFINEYRVDHAKQLLENKAYDKTILDEIAEMSGFGSKATFNRAFKKSTGMTPSLYRKICSEDQVSVI